MIIYALCFFPFFWAICCWYLFWGEIVVLRDAKGRIRQAEQYEEAATGPDMKVYRGKGKVDDVLLEGSGDGEGKHQRRELIRNTQNQNLVHNSEEENETPIIHWCKKLKRTQRVEICKFDDANFEEVDMPRNERVRFYAYDVGT
ncbi:hypothetical protein SLE2022_006980 [Rubroshorea leprosula]